MKVKVIATPEVQRLSRLASEIQNASNPKVVARFLVEVMNHFAKLGNGQEEHGSDFEAQNPLSLCIINKLNQLAELDQSRTDCFLAIRTLANGQDVECDLQ